MAKETTGAGEQIQCAMCMWALPSPASRAEKRLSGEPIAGTET